MGLTLYFMRHGETTFSAKGVYCGALDPELTPDGKQMAELFAKAYSHTAWTGIFASPMLRTLTTARPLADQVGLPIQTREGLKEISYGQWEGLSPEEVNLQDHDAYIRWLSDPGWNPPTGGERAVDIANRSAAVIREIEQRYGSSDQILVVSHKATIRIMLCDLLGIDVGRFRDRIAMPVGSVSIVEFLARGPMLKALADRSHLPETLRTRPGN
jgi:probable phosphoglycerate mutase